MCNTKKYSDMYNEIIKLQPEDTLELVKESKDKDEQEFFHLSLTTRCKLRCN